MRLQYSGAMIFVQCSIRQRIMLMIIKGNNIAWCKYDR